MDPRHLHGCNNGCPGVSSPRQILQRCPRSDIVKRSRISNRTRSMNQVIFGGFALNLHAHIERKKEREGEEKREEKEKREGGRRGREEKEKRGEKRKEKNKSITKHKYKRVQKYKSI